MPKVQLNDINLYYETHGAGAPLILISGLAARGQAFFKQVPALAARFRVITFDNRGVGESDQPQAAYSLAQMADDAAHLLDALGVPAAHVFGISMGGMIAQELALRHPARVRKLALGCTHCGIKNCAPAPAWAMEIFKNLLGKPRAQVVRECVPINYSPHTQQHHPQLITEMWPLSLDNRQQLHAYANQIAAIWAFDSYDRLPQIKAPTLVLTGQDDALIPPANSQIIAAQIPGARLLEFARAGHLFFIEQADEVNRALLEFFAN